MRQATGAAEAARSRADAANGSLTDLWGAAMATYEAARCTAAEVRTLQTPGNADVHLLLWSDIVYSVCACSSTSIAKLGHKALRDQLLPKVANTAAA